MKRIEARSGSTMFTISHDIPVRILRGISQLILIVFVLSCAAQRPPEGGPKDTEPPVVEETSPASGETNVRGNEVTIRFSEYINRQSFTDAFHISPLMAVPPEVRWSGTEVTLEFPEALVENRTYVITVGSKVKDVNGGNQLAQSFTLAFSTGDSLDRGSFGGRVFDTEPSGITLLAYQLDRYDVDTLNPSLHLPDYAQQTGNDGSFSFQNVAPGAYRVFAVRDMQNNFLYDVESDEIGIPRRDILVADSTPARLRYLLSKEDTTAPYIQSLVVRDGRYATVKFSELIDLRPFPSDRVSLRDSADGSIISFLSSYESPDGKFGHTLFADRRIKDGKYYLITDSLPDAAGNILHLEGDSILMSVSEPGMDTMRPLLVYLEPRDGTTAFPSDSAIELRFSQPMKPELAGVLQDSLGNAVELLPVWIAANTLLLRHAPLAEHMRYMLCLDLASMAESEEARTVGDSTLCISFTSDAASDYGTLVGRIVDEDSTTHTGIVVMHEHTDQLPKREVVTTPEKHEYRFLRTLPQTYRLLGAIDEDGDGHFSPGRASPFTPAERFGVFPDTVRVRSRWETNEILIRIPSDSSVAQPQP